MDNYAKASEPHNYQDSISLTLKQPESCFQPVYAMVGIINDNLFSLIWTLEDVIWLCKSQPVLIQYTLEY